jgi:hypothetical protein
MRDYESGGQIKGEWGGVRAMKKGYEKGDAFCAKKAWERRK